MNTEDNHIDNFVKQAVKGVPLEKPDSEFISSLIDKLNNLETEKNNLIIVSPVISKIGWVIVVLIIISVFTILFLFGSTTLSFPEYKLSFNNIISMYSVIDIPRVFLVGLLAFVFYFIIQIYIIVKRANTFYA